MSRQPDPVSPPVVTTIAGSDSGGGAGIQADLKTIEAEGGFGTSVVTAVTAQHTRGVERTHMLPLEEIRAQLAAVTDDFSLGAVKTGMLGTRSVVEFVTEQARSVQAPVVVDPVMVAASGDRLLNSAAEEAYQALLTEATVVTPNAPEAAVLTDVSVTDAETARTAGEQLVAAGADAALVTGGHTADETVLDVLVTDADTTEFRHPRVGADAVHGTGCALTAAVATRLAHGDTVTDAVSHGIKLLERAVQYPIAVGGGADVVHHAVGLRNRAECTTAVEAVRTLRDRLSDDVDAIARLVPAAGMSVVAATPYAEHTDECAAVEGRLARADDGVRAGEARLGASTHAAQMLLSARTVTPGLRAGISCQFDETVEQAVSELGWTVTETDQPDGVQTEDGRTAGLTATATELTEALDGEQPGQPSADSPLVVVGRGAGGTEPTGLVLTGSTEQLVTELSKLSQTVQDDIGHPTNTE
ncbi:MAG: phosphomethylpyrimidine kinase [halophilic archaeon J07HX5]|jgi:phosphomethylpyrimidine kinase|nr:MAG: phosphomethylpyrimidine kinase [halophilic archaeon J07HX5]